MCSTNEITRPPLWRIRLSLPITRLLENKDVIERWGGEIGEALLNWGINYLQEDAKKHSDLTDDLICSRIVHKATLINLIIRQVNVILGEQHSEEPLSQQQLRFQFTNLFKTVYQLTHRRTTTIQIKRAIELCEFFYQLTSYQLFSELLGMIDHRQEEDLSHQLLPFFKLHHNKENIYHA